ncbi:RRM domain-containing protein, partial [Teratosphaeria destructans]
AVLAALTGRGGGAEGLGRRWWGCGLWVVEVGVLGATLGADVTGRELVDSRSSIRPSSAETRSARVETRPIARLEPGGLPKEEGAEEERSLRKRRGEPLSLDIADCGRSEILGIPYSHCTPLYEPARSAVNPVVSSVRIIIIRCGSFEQRGRHEARGDVVVPIAETSATMSGDEDTFEIDIYGDEPQAASEPAPVREDPKENGAANGSNGDVAETAIKQEASSATPAPQQGTKRKAEDDGQNGDYHGNQQQQQQQQGYDQNYVDNRPLDPGAMPSLKLSELHWWTTEEDLRGLCAQAGAEDELHEVAFGEHKINGKSKGEAYLEFSSPQAATAVKRAVETAARGEGGDGPRKMPFTVWFTG